jgi:hypothetical protein
MSNMPKKFKIIIPHPNLMLLPRPVARNLLWREPNFGNFLILLEHFPVVRIGTTGEIFFVMMHFLVRKMVIFKAKIVKKTS